ncbi:hypothetical protein COV20_00325 [Candidatus Woesearchaeota archaeon CG10_big_fil_rev_8_21_14_0_10_45_16]|nr:MAG: hypothetical protein COV20_00325 [Candidatus Woesearchaeota archaeon CG10_big_fil_rev_8_21_14_0_10_45_16]
MKPIEKKIWPQYFEKVLSGDKTFEIRLADWECRPGETLILREWDPDTKQYTGRVLEKKVGYVARIKPTMLPFWSADEVEKHGLQIISLK